MIVRSRSERGRNEGLTCLLPACSLSFWRANSAQIRTQRIYRRPDVRHLSRWDRCGGGRPLRQRTRVTGASRFACAPVLSDQIAAAYFKSLLAWDGGRDLRIEFRVRRAFCARGAGRDSEIET